MNISDFFGNNYLNTGSIEVINQTVETGHDNAELNLWANRRVGDAHWLVTLELYEKRETDEGWYQDTMSFMIDSDEKLINFVQNFAQNYFNEYFPFWEEE